ncbi:MAG: hypothetical protein JKX88_03140, partial [Marinicaulis sp.]|nr:hypothetical protein [Marinicaulis sp.]
IEDPYFACENVLNPVSDFIRNEIFERFGFPEKTLLHSFDPDHPKIRNRMNEMGKGAVKQKICERVGMAIQFNFEGPRNKYFHDRSMVFVLNTDYGMKNVRWNLPAGLEHWLDENRPQQETTQICESKAQWS